jgi:hypothetical protein
LLFYSVGFLDGWRLQLERSWAFGGATGQALNGQAFNEQVFNGQVFNGRFFTVD